MAVSGRPYASVHSLSVCPSMYSSTRSVRVHDVKDPDSHPVEGVERRRTASLSSIFVRIRLERTRRH